MNFSFYNKNVKYFCFSIVNQRFINETNLCSDDWKQSKCNCREFAKHYICIHVLGLAYRYKLCIIPEEAKTISISQKRKRGRPKKQKAALFYQIDCDLSSSKNESNPEQY
ncbi:hypothetical protein BpHYR1_011578 [Brachionus plicatilis]|uniref:SWIM-type domain-containing protein n=1 Tax=Brachionus plicatilis TaxID=10195 RepID=A0A3M7SBJ4_BRAPC|nr:hypothetical protein BpHYR1_011578 [Brachionus plicatilis]